MDIVYIWVDDLRPKIANYDVWYKSVWEFIRDFESRGFGNTHYVIDLDHDAGDYENFGGDYYNILKWMEWYFHGMNFVETHVVFKFHTANPVGKQNMINICERNNWRYET